MNKNPYINIQQKEIKLRCLNINVIYIMVCDVTASLKKRYNQVRFTDWKSVFGIQLVSSTPAHLISYSFILKRRLGLK